MTRLSFRRGEPKASIIDGLVEKRPGQHVVVTAIEQLYSRDQIKGFANELAVKLMPHGAAAGIGGVRRAREAALENVGQMVGLAFKLYSESRGFTDETREKWRDALDEMKSASRGNPLAAMLRGGRPEAPSGILELVPVG